MSKFSEVKLVQERNFADDAVAERHVEDVIRQGISSGWGMRPEDASLLNIVRRLDAALDAAEKAEEAQRKLKGEQLAHGRTKKALESSRSDFEAAAENFDALLAKSQEQKKQIEQLRCLVDEERKNRVEAND
jgi:hypothetical protein